MAAERESSTRGELIDKVVKIRRCAAVVKGGRRFSFTALVVVGDGRGKVGWGYGKANEVPPAVEKAVKDGTRKMVAIALKGTSIPHAVRRPIRRLDREAGARRAGHRRQGRLGGPRRLRSGRHPRHPYQESTAQPIHTTWPRPPSRPLTQLRTQSEVERLRGVSLS